jgi:Uma2 family endonuclease
MPLQTAPPPAATWPEQGHWTYEDWLRLPDDGFRYEVLHGVLYMSPPPAVPHQDFQTELVSRMRLHARQGRLGIVLAAPVGVRLPGEPVPLQPDILFVRQERASIVGKEYVEGAPDLLVEVLSPSNWQYDRKEKFLAYQAAGVPEYWIVNVPDRMVEVSQRPDRAAKRYRVSRRARPGEILALPDVYGVKLVKI